LKGVGNGLISSLLYLKNPDKYNIFLGTLSKGLLTVYPDKRSTFNYSRDQFDKNYSAFNDLVNRLRSECSLVPQQVDIVLTVLAEEAEETAPIAMPVKPEESPPITLAVDMQYIPPIVADIERIAADDKEYAVARYNKVPQLVLEDQVCIVGTMLGFEVQPLGQGKGRVPDAIWRGEIRTKRHYAVLVDAKARMDGYDMGTDYREITDYLGREGRPLEKRGYTVYYAIISQRFKGDPEGGVRYVVDDQRVASSLTLLTAQALLRMIELRLTEPLLGLDDLERVFRQRGIVTADDIYDLVT
jgi:hypothetical protein